MLVQRIISSRISCVWGFFATFTPGRLLQTFYYLNKVRLKDSMMNSLVTLSNVM